MPTQNGDLVSLAIGNGATPSESFTPLGGLRATSFTLENRLLDASGPASGSWRALQEAAGIRSLSLTAAGAFTNSTAEASLRSDAFSGTARNFELSFGNGDRMSGPFIVASYRRTGDYGSEETYTLTLASAGELNYIAG